MPREIFNPEKLNQIDTYTAVKYGFGDLPITDLVKGTVVLAQYCIYDGGRFTRKTVFAKLLEDVIIKNEGYTCHKHPVTQDITNATGIYAKTEQEVEYFDGITPLDVMRLRPSYEEMEKIVYNF